MLQRWIAHTVAGLAVATWAIGCTQGTTPEPAQAPVAPRQPAAAPAAPLAAPEKPAAATVAAAAPAAGAPAQWKRTEIAVLPWGSGPAQAGHVAQGDQNLEGPMALDVGADGKVWLLDQVNARILVLGLGQPPRSIPASRTAQDLILDGNSQPWTLDRLVDRQVRRLDPLTGAVTQTLDLATAGVAEPGLSTALWLHEGALWLEMENTRLVPLQAKATAKQGRPSRDGKWVLSALRVPPDKVAVAGRGVDQGDAEAPRLALQHQFELPLFSIADLDSDAAGRVWLTADLVRFGPDDRPLDRKRNAIAWTPGGKIAAQVELCAPVGAEEQFRTVRITAAGEVFNLCRGPAGVVVERWAP